MSMTQRILLSDYGACPSCRTSLIHDDSSYHAVCPACGLQGERCRAVNQGKYEEELIDSQYTTFYANGQRTLLGFRTNRRGCSSGSQLDRMVYWNDVPLTAKDLHLRRTIPTIFKIAGVVPFSRQLTHQAIFLYMKAFDAFRISHRLPMILAAFYMAVRGNELPITLEEIIRRGAPDVPIKKVREYLRKFMRELDCRMKPVNVPRVLLRFGQAFHFPFAMIREAVELYDWCKINRVFGGHDPWVIAAGVLYYLGKKYDLRKSQREIAEVMYTTQVSVQDANRLIKTARG